MSSPKQVLFEEEARAKLLSGIEKLADVLAFTLGPRGRNVGIDQSWGAPQITSDGGSIVKEVDLEDQWEDMGVKMGKEVASKIKEACGDGTTTGTLLLRSLVATGVKNITAGASPILLKRGMEQAVEAVLQKLDETSLPVKGDEDTKNIATVSASGNSEIGEMITKALGAAGKGGVVTVEEGKGTDTILETVDGMQFDRGYLSAYFCTNQDKLTVEMNSPSILLVDKKIGSIQELLPILQAIAGTGRELLIVAEDLEGDALATLVVNKIRGTLKVAAVKAPGFGDRRKAMLQDLAVLTGGTVVSEETGTQLKDATVDLLGSAERITITKDETVIVGGSGSEEAIKGRIGQIEAELANATSSYDKEKLEERRAKLGGGVAVIRVGAPSEAEMKQTKQLMEDSLNSTKAAIASGVVIGGGVALFRAAEVIDSLKLEGDEKVGAAIVKRACETPIRQLAINAGVDGSVVISEVAAGDPKLGFNVLTGKVEDLLKVGVIDPASVVKATLSHAASVAGLVLLSEALIGDADD